MEESIKKRIEAVRRGETPEGYRRTRAGLMPLDWDDACAAKDVFRNHVDRKHGGNGEVLSVTQDRGIIPRRDVEIDIKYDEESLNTYKKVEIGDFVISLRSFQGGIEYSPYEGLVSPAYTVLKAVKPIDRAYYKVYFKTNDFIRRLNGAVYGIRDGKQIGFDDFGDLAIHYPPLQEQQKIAEILAVCDRAIELKKELLEEKRRQKRWLAQKVHPPKKHGRRAAIGSLGLVTTGATPDTKRPEYWGGGIRWMNSGDLNLKQVYEVEGRITLMGLNKSGTQLLPPNCVLVGLAGQGKTRGTVAINRVELCTNQSIAAIHPSEQYEPEFLYHYLDNKYSELRRISSGDGARGGLNLDLIENFVVCLPGMEEQRRIAVRLSAADREIELLEQECDAWKQKKKALTQLLLTGLVRVKA